MFIMIMLVLVVVVVISWHCEVESFFEADVSLSRSKKSHITDPGVLLPYSQEIMLHLTLSKLITEHM
jgi:hypothetical protein